MTERKSILLIIEPDTHPLEVVDRAIWLAGASDCSLHMILCDPDIGPLHENWYLSAQAKEIGQNIRDAQNEMIEELADIARKAGIDVTTDILEDRPLVEGILHQVLEHNPRYLMKGTQYHSVAERAIFVDTDWQLIRRSTCPVYLVKPKKLSENPVLLAAVDPMHSHDKAAMLDQAIVDQALTISNATQGEVHLLHTYQRIAGIGNADTHTFKPVKIPIDDLDMKISAEHREQLDALANANHIDSEHVHQLPGRTKEILPTFVRAHNVDIVVMGAVARWGLKRMAIGSTAERVLDHLPCDVLVIANSGVQVPYQAGSLLQGALEQQ
jgi:universal stress protein E